MGWTRSDLISAGSLGIAALALAYGPVKDLQAAHRAPEVTVDVRLLCVAAPAPAGSTGTAAPPGPPDPPATAVPAPTAPAPDGAGAVVPCPRGGSTPELSGSSGLIPGRSSGGPSAFARMEVAGTSRNIPADRDLWVVLRPEDDGRFYPVTSTLVQDGGGWTAREDVRPPRAVTTYAVFVYLADSQASRQLKVWDEREDRKPPERYEGLPSLPPNLTLMASTSVTLPP